MENKICVLCGREFVPSGRNKSRQKYCNDIHYKNCEVCEKQFEITKSHIQSSNIPKCCSKECSNKLKIFNSRKTIREKYGVEFISQSPEFREGMNASIKAKSSRIKESRKKTMLDRYGVEYPIQNKDIRDKIDKTNLKKYGVTNVAKNKDIGKKISNSLRDPLTQAKRIEASLEKYGTEYPSQSERVKDKTAKTNLEKYGVKYSIQSPSVYTKARQRQMMVRRGNPEIAKRIAQSTHLTCISKYGVDWPCQLPQCKRASNGKSKINDDFYKLLASHNINYREEFPIGKYSYDVLLLDTKTLIEINPTYTHNAIGNHWGSGLDKFYHRDKTNVGINNGYRVIHIWQWDDVDRILTMLKDKRIIYARQCEVRVITQQTANEFLNIYHLQGAVSGQKVCLGLYYEDQLIEVTTFGKPRYNKNYQWELLRLCTHCEYKVVGGASKLFSHFVKNNNPQSIISYCDRSKFTGDVYERIGMKLDKVTEPNKIWSKSDMRITNNLLLSRGYDQLFNTDFGKGASNEQLMIADGWLPVYDCGQYRFIWRPEYV